MPRVSILIPCYNVERWVAQAIQSALDQTHDDKEVIIVDDGSTDGSLDVIKSYSNSIRWEAGPNRGGNAARNRLLELAQGEWLQYLDADDYLKPEKIASQLRSWQESGSIAEVIYSPLCVENWSDGSVTDTTVLPVDSSQTIEEQWIRWRVAQTGTVLWKRSALARIGGWNEQYACCQDNEATLRAIQHRIEFHFSPTAKAVYRVWSDDTVCHKDPTRVIEIKTHLIEQMLALLDKRGRLNVAAQEAAGQAFFEMARTIACSDLKAGVRYFGARSQVVRLRPSGPAGPPSYRLVYGLLGFRFAELVSRVQRKLKGLYSHNA